ncbi:35147_t:CDS:1, partial [Gigaspora margarita]
MYIECVLNQKSFIITVLTDKENPLKSGFQCTCDSIKSKIKSHLLAAVNACYKEVFKTKTEYSRLAVIGFENTDIIQQLISDIEFFPIFLYIEKLNIVVSSIGDLNKSKFYGVGAGFVSLFTARYQNVQHLFVLKIKENECSLEIYLESVCKNKIKGKTPDEVWNKVEIYKKYTGTYLFGIMNKLVQKHIEELRNESL